MLRASREYKRMMDSPLRNRGYIKVSLGIINQTAQKNCSISTPELFSTPGTVFDMKTKNCTYATFEENYMPCDGSMYFLPEAYPLQSSGFISKSFITPIHLDFNNSYDIKGLTIEFEPTSYPTSLIIKADSFEKTFECSEYIFEMEDVLGATSMIEIIPLKMSGGQQRVHIKSILMGVMVNFDNDTIQEVSMESSVSPVSDSVSYTNVSGTFFDVNKVFDVFNEDSFMGYFEPLQPFKMYIGVDLDEDGNKEWKEVANCYIKDWAYKAGKLTVTATDKLTQLVNNYSNNTLETRSVYSEFESVLLDAGFDSSQFIIDSFLQNVNIKNPIPECNHRECLQLLANAYRCIIFEDELGVLNVKANFETVLNLNDFIVESDDVMPWANLKNVPFGATREYADFTTGLFPLNETTYFLPDDKNYQNTGYVSSSISDLYGNFERNPYIDIYVPATYSCYGITVLWGGQVPKECKLYLYRDGLLLDTFTYTELSKRSVFNENFLNFNRVKIEVTKSEPYSRVLINKVAYGSATDYELTKDHMVDNPVGVKEERVKEVRVKVYTYQENDSGEIEEVKDDIYYTAEINTTGVIKTCNNPLISSYEQAILVGEWLGNYYRNNVSYSVSYRGEPRVQASDIITMQTDYEDNLEVEVQTASLKFNGAFTGTLDMRKALRKSYEQEV